MAPLEIQLLGQPAVRRGIESLALPASRKVRALLGFMALSPHPVMRSHLCDLLWDGPNDPRGELRWCLSRMRRLVDEPGVSRIETAGDSIALNLSGCFVDALAINQAAKDGFETRGDEELRTIAELFVGDLLAGLEFDRNPSFESWLVAQRRRFREIHVSLLDHLTRLLPAADARLYVDRWIQIAPYDLRPHELLLNELAAEGKIREGGEHLKATTKLFKDEGFDAKPLHTLWNGARAQLAHSTRPHAVVMTTTKFNDLDAEPENVETRRASVAVMPFVDVSAVTLPGGPADALVYDVILRLAKLRNVRVIAQGTVFALHEQRIAPEVAGRLLGVDYIVSGSVRRSGNRFAASVELAETKGSNIVWTELFEQDLEDTLVLLDEIGNRIVVSIDREVEIAERNRAILKSPNSLGAWEAHHRGLWHMYRFTKSDNEQAQHFFKMALRMDQTFARAHAGLSFTHWQNAFQGWADRKIEAERAYASASDSLMADDRDPAAHLALGRALWLRGQQPQSINELESAVDLSPSFAMGHYSLAFVHCQLGDPSAAVTAADHSRNLSPYDPLLFGMLASRAMALVRLGRFEEAADWGVKAAARPNAHAQIWAIAALSLALAGRVDEGRSMLASIHATSPGYRLADFLVAFHFSAADAALFTAGAKQIGLN